MENVKNYLFTHYCYKFILTILGVQAKINKTKFVITDNSQ